MLDSSALGVRRYANGRTPRLWLSAQKAADLPPHFCEPAHFPNAARGITFGKRAANTGFPTTGHPNQGVK
jgi:hypothetical protein